MERDEVGTLNAMKALRTKIFAPTIAAHHGRIVKLMGDGALVEFASVVDAVACAVAVQQRLADAQREGSPIQLRIGVHLGDIIIEGRDIYGGGVNIAARLQEVAPPGGVAISASAHEHVLGSVDADFSDDGVYELKNIAAPMRVFRWEDSEPSFTPGSIPMLPDKPSIAILPFDNMSGEQEQEYFADGVVEALTAALSRIRSFFVIARNSAFAYKGRSVNVRQIGRELGVAYVLEGSVQRAGNRVRITVQLIETGEGRHLWADRYDGSLDDIFDLQDKITEQVAGALQPSIRQAEIERARNKRPQDLNAYDYAMRAIRHVWRLERAEADRAIELLDKSLEIDPDYPLALALAAWCWAQRSVYNWWPDTAEARTKAVTLAERAAALSSDDPLILAVLGAVHTFARNHGAARVLLERAIQLDPNSAWALSRLGWLETYADRPEAAREHFDRAMRLSPLDPMNFNNLVGMGSACQVAGDDQGAIDYFQRALVERPNALWIHRNLAPALLATGQREAAERSIAALRAAHPDLTIAKFKEAMVFSPRVLDRIGELQKELGLPEE